MERPSRDGTSDTSSCQAPGRAGVRGGWLAAQRPSGCHGSRGRRSVRCGRRNRAYFQAVYFQTSGVVDGRQWSVGARQLAGTRGAVRIDAGGGAGGALLNDRDGWCCLWCFISCAVGTGLPGCKSQMPSPRPAASPQLSKFRDTVVTLAVSAVRRLLAAPWPPPRYPNPLSVVLGTWSQTCEDPDACPTIPRDFPQPCSFHFPACKGNLEVVSRRLPT